MKTKIHHTHNTLCYCLSGASCAFGGPWDVLIKLCKGLINLARAGAGKAAAEAAVEAAKR